MIADIGCTKPAAGVMQTKPATAPDDAPSTVGRPRDVALARRAMLADPRGAPRTDPAALVDPAAAPAAMFPGEG